MGDSQRPYAVRNRGEGDRAPASTAGAVLSSTNAKVEASAGTGARHTYDFRRRIAISRRPRRTRTVGRSTRCRLSPAAPNSRSGLSRLASQPCREQSTRQRRTCRRARISRKRMPLVARFSPKRGGAQRPESTLAPEPSTGASLSFNCGYTVTSSSSASPATERSHARPARRRTCLPDPHPSRARLSPQIACCSEGHYRSPIRSWPPAPHFDRR